jgi:pimeloyl-ACP methyl ester carboxylesterase
MNFFNSFFGRLRIALAAFLCLGLLACGGGGGGSSTTPTPTSQIGGLSFLQSGDIVVTQGYSSQYMLNFTTSAKPADVVVKLKSTDPIFSLSKDVAKGIYQLSVDASANSSVGVHSVSLEAVNPDGASTSLNQSITVKAPDALQSKSISASQPSAQFDNGTSVSLAAGTSITELSITVTTTIQADGSKRYGFKSSRELTEAEMKQINISTAGVSAVNAAASPASGLQYQMLQKIKEVQIALGILPSPTIWAGNRSGDKASRVNAGGNRVANADKLSVWNLTQVCGYRIFAGIDCLEEYAPYQLEALLPDSDYADKEIALFIHGFTLGNGFGGDTNTSDNSDGTLISRVFDLKSTWGNFPAVVTDSTFKINGKAVAPLNFRWKTGQRFEDAATDLLNALLEVRRRYPNKKVHVVAHSFGGLLIRTFLQRLGTARPADPSAYIASVVTLGSPHSGINDTDGNMHGVYFKAGQDKYLVQRAAFNACMQISCHQAGETVAFAGATLVTLLPEVYGISASPGELVAKLADTATNPLPAAVPITVGIGLTTDRNGLGKLDKGDALISYEGQRFLPDLTSAGRKPLLACNRTYFTQVQEKILGAVGDKGPGEFPFGTVSEVVRYAGYKHSGLPPSMNLLDSAAGVVSALRVWYGDYTYANFALLVNLGSEIYRGARYLESEANLSCTSAASCQHASFLLAKAHFAGSNCNGPKITSISCTTAAIGRPVSCTVRGTGLLQGILFSAGSYSVSEVGTGTDTQRVFSFTPTAAGDLSVSVGLADDTSIKLSTQTVAVQAGPTQTPTIISVYSYGGVVVLPPAPPISLGVRPATPGGAIEVSQGGYTTDTKPTISGTLSAALTATQTLRVYDGSAILGTASVSGTTWSFTPSTALPLGSRSFSARVSSVDGIEGAASNTWVANIMGVTNISPSAAQVNVPTTFVLSGGGLPLTAVLALADSTCQTPTARAATGFSVVCTPLSTGSKVATVKTDTQANSGQVIDASKTVTVSTTGAVTGKLPHSGVTSIQCYQAASNTLVACSSAGATALNNQQDGHRTAIDAMSYSAVSNNAGGSYPLTSCVKDNVTGLMWEGKEASGTRAGGNTYTNYHDQYFGTTAQMYAATNTYGYVNHVNSIALCGYTDWRLPSVNELQTIVDYSRLTGATINANYFVNTPGFYYWTSDPVLQGSSSAWNVDFRDQNGDTATWYRYSSGGLRLVRKTQ